MVFSWETGRFPKRLADRGAPERSVGSVPRKLPLFATGKISKNHVLHGGFIPTLTALGSLWWPAAVALEYECSSQQELRGIMGSWLLDSGTEVRSERTKW